jgi:hypothetical protein
MCIPGTIMEKVVSVSLHSIVGVGLQILATLKYAGANSRKADAFLTLLLIYASLKKDIKAGNSCSIKTVSSSGSGVTAETSPKKKGPYSERKVVIIPSQSDETDELY